MKLKYIFLLILLSSFSVHAQLNLPRESQRGEIAQSIGDTRIAVVYHRPNIKNRKIWGRTRAVRKSLANGRERSDDN